MNKIFLYTIWQRVPDYIENPLLPEDLFLEPGQETFTVTERGADGEGDVEVTHDVMVLDPNNGRGVRYVAIKCIDDINVAQQVCANPSGEYIYTYQEAWFGEGQ